jgi:hypothetical protein
MLRAQTRTARAPATKKEPAVITCPAELGTGVKTKRLFCDVLIGSDPAQGILVTIPPHAGPAYLSFDLHNRHTYSEEEIRAKRAFTRLTATTGVLTMNNDLLQRAVVQSEFRTAADVFDRIGGGAGPGGVKAVVPTGVESIVVTIPDKLTEVSLLGEKVQISRLSGSDLYTSPGRPAAVVSNVTIEYRPAPARRRR